MILDRSQSFTYYDLSLSKLQRCEKKTVQKNHIQRLVSLSSLSKPFKHLFSMTMKSRNLYKSWDSPGKHCSKVWGSAEISRLLIKSCGVDSPFSSTQAPTWTVWGWCEDEWESYAPSYISFLRFKYTKPQRSRCARKFCISGLDFLFFFFLSAVSAAAANVALDEEQPGGAGRGQRGPQGAWILRQPVSAGPERQQCRRAAVPSPSHPAYSKARLLRDAPVTLLVALLGGNGEEGVKGSKGRSSYF